MIDLLHPWALVLLIPMVLWIAVLRRGHALGLALLPGGWATAVQPSLQRSIATRRKMLWANTDMNL